ncbi:MAG TPA: hypothetical protein VL329_11945 [Nitrospiraceae bacterium]|jgi:hypothetical protein|nr:hypothetical protein [Nitrospiraceae bacterium]
MRHYCTLSDINYLPKLLVMYESLKKHWSEDFILYVLALDEETLRALDDLDLQSATGIDIEYFKSEQMPYVSQRTWQEYCWTAASNLCQMLLNQGVQFIDALTYLDADLMFFSDPKVVFDEIGDRSIAVIPHRFIPSKRHLEVNGKFNVSWVTFKNDPIGRECASTWAAQCREKCSATDGCGDQKYLDAWPAKYGHHLCVIEHIGAGLAPWNLANYKPMSLHWDGSDQLMIGIPFDNGVRGLVPVVFYHYHEFLWTEKSVRLTNYKLRNEDIQLIYGPYLEAYKRAQDKIASLHISA